jgi:hypothetical protein
MINKDLLNYINQQLEAGKDVLEIVQALQDAGWTDSEILAGFKSIGKPLTDKQLQQLGIDDSKTVAGVVDEIPGAMDLIKETIEKFKQGGWKVLVISLIPTVLFLVAGVAAGLGFAGSMLPSLMSGGNPFSAGSIGFGLFLLLALGVVFMVIQTWSTLAGIYMAQHINTADIKTAFQETKSKILKSWWMMLLYTLIIIGGMYALIIPAFFLAFWLSFFLMILVTEDIGGLKGLIKSREYMRGRGWKIYWRFLFPGLLIAVGMIVITTVFNSMNMDQLTGIIQFVLNIVLPPATIIYTYTVYDYARRSKPELANFEPKKGQRIGFTIWALVGVLGTVGIMIVGAMSAANFSEALRQGEMAKDRNQEIQQMLEEYEQNPEMREMMQQLEESGAEYDYDNLPR